MLSDVIVEEVSFVKKGANNKVIIFKAFDEEINEDDKMDKVDKRAPSFREELMPEEDEELMTEEETDKTKKSKTKKGGIVGDSSMNENSPLGKKCQKSDELTKSVEDLQKSFAIMQKELSDAKIAKEVTDKKNVALEKALQTELDMRVTKEHIEIAARDYSRLGDATTVGPIMKEAASKLEPETYSKLTKILQDASDRLENSAFTEIGKSGAAPVGSVAEKVAAIVADKIEKSDGKLSKEMIEARVWADHPDWYAQYQREMYRS